MNKDKFKEESELFKKVFNDNAFYFTDIPKAFEKAFFEAFNVQVYSQRLQYYCRDKFYNDSEESKKYYIIFMMCDMTFRRSSYENPCNPFNIQQLNKTNGFQHDFYDNKKICYSDIFHIKAGLDCHKFKLSFDTLSYPNLQKAFNLLKLKNENSNKHSGFVFSEV